MPIFYNVLPTEVRTQTGEFGIEFAKLKKRLGSQRTDKWAAALTEVANLSGSELGVLTNGHEAEFIEIIIQDVKKEVNHTPLHVASYPVGVDFRAKNIIESLLQKGREDDVRMVGIYGLGGIGKTTLAKDIYNRLFQRVNFEGSCFLSNVRSEDKKFGLHNLQEKLLNILFKTADYKVNNVPEGINLIRRRLGSMKVLIVLDDVDSEEQFESLAKERSWFGSGSLIIITTRDMQVLRRLGEEERYEAKPLNDDEAQQLFYLHAFNSLSPPQEYVELAQAIIKYSCGLPLGLVTLGSHLRLEPIENWRRDFNKLIGPTPHTGIQNILKVSFDGLDGKTQCVFLDIACAFRDYFEVEVTGILNACGFHTECEIATLVQKQLLQRDGLHLVMHDLVRDMAREIVRSESRYTGERSRLFIPEEVYAVLQGKKGTMKVEVLRLDQPGELKGVDLSTDAFEPMKKLRVLEINELHISGDFGLFPKELKWLSWQKCPLKYIPPNFPAADLVVLYMQRSDIEEFDLNLQCCPRLKELSLSYCENLRKTPKFNGARSLEALWLTGCYSLTKIDQSICQLKSLQVLDITGCFSIRKLPIDLGEMHSLRSLRASGTGIKQLPKFVEKLRNLETLEVGGQYLQVNQRRVIKSLSTSLSSLVLRNFGLSEAAFRVDIGSLSSLIFLDLSGNSFHALPFDFSKLRLLKELRLNDCENLQTLPSVSNLENLETIELRNCKKLVKITGLDNLPSIQEINMVNCISMQNPFNEGFFSAHSLSIPSRVDRGEHINDQVLEIYVQCNEIPDWCSNQVTAPYICLTMPLHNKEYKFLGMVLWFVCDFSDATYLLHFVVTVAHKKPLDFPQIRYTIKPELYREVSCVYYISCLHRPFDGLMIKGGEQITVQEFNRIGSVKKIGIHLLYLDQHDNVISLPAVVDHSYTVNSKRRSAGHKRAKF